MILDDETMARFRTYVNVKKKGCWNWLGGTTPNGYGKFAVHGVAKLAHRVSYQYFFETLEDSKVVHHTCGNRLCVNPGHLEMMTYTKHNREHSEAMSEAAIQESCHRGHSLSGENLYIYSNGKRGCRTCKMIYNRTVRRERRYWNNI